jgi:cell division septal protein FtsQ
MIASSRTRPVRRRHRSERAPRASIAVWLMVFGMLVVIALMAVVFALARR